LKKFKREKKGGKLNPLEPFLLGGGGWKAGERRVLVGAREQEELEKNLLKPLKLE